MQYAKRGITILVAGITLAGAGTAHADGGLTVTEVQKHKRQPVELANCRNDGGTCSIERGKSTSASVSSSIGVTVSDLNASMGTSYQETYTDTAGCSRSLERGQRLVMYPSGDFVFFEQNGEKGTAFLPTGVECIVESDW